jgi:xanthosine utilization system XapX-like protein
MAKTTNFKRGDYVISKDSETVTIILVTGPGDNTVGYKTFAGVVVSQKPRPLPPILRVGNYSLTWSQKAFTKTQYPAPQPVVVMGVKSFYVGDKIPVKETYIKIMSFVDGYVTWRYKGCVPSVCSIKEFESRIKKLWS